MTKSFEQWSEQARLITPEGRAFIDGEFHPSRSGECFDAISPVTGERLASVASCGADDVDRAVRSARRAFEAGHWSRAAPADRKAALLRLADLMERDAEHLALLETLDMGKPISDALTVDVPGAIGVLRWFAEACDKIYDEIAPTGDGNPAMVRRRPLGVVGAVVPWNFPLDMAVWKLAPALAAGNSVVLKPAEQSPLSALHLASLVAEADIPVGVVNVVPGFGETAGQALGLHSDIDCVTFTGSTATGKRFMAYSAQSNLKQVWLECGGKSPNVVFDDIDDVDAAVDMAAFGIFFNQGEVCSANSRLLVQRGIRDEFVSKLRQRADALRPGHPLDPETKLGALVDVEHTHHVMSHIDRAKSDARLVTGGRRITVTTDCYVEPTIFDDVPAGSPLATDEVFGPVLAVIEFDTEEQAVAMANASDYGLAASVWTSDLSRALRVGDALEAGTVSINTVDALSPMTPFGGFKQSGFGRDLSLHALDKFTGLKTVWIDYGRVPAST